MQKQAISRKALKLYRPLLQKKNSYGLDIPLTRAADLHEGGGFLHSVTPVKRTYKSPALSPEVIKTLTEPRQIILGKAQPKKSTSFFQKLKATLQQPHIKRVAALAHELGHLDNLMEAKRDLSIITPKARQLKQLAQKTKTQRLWEKRYGPSLTDKAEEITASRKAMQLAKELPLSSRELKKIDQDLVKSYKSYSPKTKITSFNK